MKPQLVPSEVSREVWRVARDRCQCALAACHGAPGRCGAPLDSGMGRVRLVDPRGPKAAWNCILLCAHCLDAWRRTGKPD